MLNSLLRFLISPFSFCLENGKILIEFFVGLTIVCSLLRACLTVLLSLHWCGRKVLDVFEGAIMMVSFSGMKSNHVRLVVSLVLRH